METRGIITIEEKTVVLPDAEVWMTTGEIAGLFYVRGVSVEAAINLRHGNGHSPVVPVRHGAGGTVPQMARPDGGVFQERAYGLVPASSAWGILLNGTSTV